MPMRTGAGDLPTTLKSKYHQAVPADFTEAIRLDPRDADSHCNRGRAYEKKDDLDKAITDYTEAIRIAPRWRRIFGPGSLP